MPEAFPKDLFVTATQHKSALDDLQAWMQAQPQVEAPVHNTFASGVYSRQVYIKAGTLFAGRVHVSEHIAILLTGDLTFITADGPVRMSAPCSFVAPAGSKKVAYANTDSTLVTFHPAVHHDPEVLHDTLTVGTFAEYDALVERVRKSLGDNVVEGSVCHSSQLQ